MTEVLECSTPSKVSPYNFEADLIETVISNLAIFLPRAAPYVAWREQVIGAGKVDIVLASTVPSTLAERLLTDTTQTAQRDLNGLVLSQLHPRRALSAATVAKHSGLEINTVTDLLYNLVAIGLCEARSKTSYVRTERSRQFIDIISIEGKLANWRVALAQAYRDRLFSNFTYVVLDASHARPAVLNKDKFASAGVGLALAFAESNIVKIIHRPKSGKPISPINHAIAHETLIESMARSKAYFSKECNDVIYHD